MLALITGKNYTQVKKEADNIAKDFLKSNSSQIEYHTTETIKPKDLLYRAEGQSLFGDKAIYIIDGLVDESKDEVLKILGTLTISANLFIFCEESVIKEIEKSFTDKGAKFITLKSDAKEESNPFAITDALISKDKKRMWHLYRRELDKGENPEAIMGRLAWVMKTLNLIIKNPKNSAADLGISPFVYSKTNSGMSKWTPDSAQKFYANLLFGLPSGGEMEYHLEKLILNM